MQSAAGLASSEQLRGSPPPLDFYVFLFTTGLLDNRSREPSIVSGGLETLCESNGGPSSLERASLPRQSDPVFGKVV